jgi:diaminopimelate decarboxylase
LKTQPVRPLLRRWREDGRGVEVVNDFELSAALAEGFEPSKIVVNGVGKHSWLSRSSAPGLIVHFDSLHEVRKLAKQAKRLEWHTGIRLHVADEFDPDEPRFGGQFGFNTEEAGVALEILRAEGVVAESVQFHLRSNVEDVECYRRALNETARVFQQLGLEVKYLDSGGGLPIQYAEPGGRAQDRECVSGYTRVLADSLALYPNLKELWLENGRFMTSRAGVLVITVIDIKDRPDCRYLICEGGRTNHALVSDWETHRVFTVPHRAGRSCLTTVCGPNCMAYDRLTRTELPEDIKIGDRLVWTDAGAYHLPWESRFSHGLANVVWYDGESRLQLARQAEGFEEWWGLWR